MPRPSPPSATHGTAWPGSSSPPASSFTSTDRRRRARADEPREEDRSSRFLEVIGGGRGRPVATRGPDKRRGGEWRRPCWALADPPRSEGEESADHLPHGRLLACRY